MTTDYVRLPTYDKLSSYLPGDLASSSTGDSGVASRGRSLVRRHDQARTAANDPYYTKI